LKFVVIFARAANVPDKAAMSRLLTNGSVSQGKRCWACVQEEFRNLLVYHYNLVGFLFRKKPCEISFNKSTFLRLCEPANNTYSCLIGCYTIREKISVIDFFA